MSVDLSLSQIMRASKPVVRLPRGNEGPTGSIEQRADSFLVYARNLCRARGDAVLAHRWAEQGGAAPEVVEILRSAIVAGTTTNPGWAAEVAGYSNLVAAFAASLRNVGVFDTMLPYMKRVPLHVRTAIATTGATAGAIGEGQVRPISRLTLSGGTLDERVAVGILVVTDQLLKVGGAQADAIFASELRRAVAASVDADFVSVLNAGTGATVQTATTAVGVLNDIGSGLAAMSLDQSSRVFMLTGGAFLQTLSTLPTTTGALAFPGITSDGGEIGSVSVLPSDAVTGTSFILVDANQIAAASDLILLDSSRGAAIVADSSPSSPPTGTDTLTSLWAAGMLGLRAERHWGVERLRSTAVAKVA